MTSLRSAGATAPGFVRSIEVASAVSRTWGVRGLARRGAHEILQRGGVLPRLERRLLDQEYGSVSLRCSGLLRSGRPLGEPTGEAVLYGGLHVPIPSGAGWHVHPASARQYDGARHWSELSDSDPAAGDIKDLWELGRLAWVLAIAVNDAGGDERALEVVRDWIASNPPYRGPHWMCGQETALRGIALLSLADLTADKSGSQDRQLIAEAVARSVDRVRLTLRYALSQRNNHAISEAGFLWGASVLVSGLPGGNRVRRRATRALNEAIRDQFLADGSYAQHSPTYQRLAVHVLLWCLRVSNATGAPLPAEVRPALERSLPFLTSLVAPASDGRVPNLGGNDGALLFDFTTCPITDFRPVIVHLHAALGRSSPYPPGPWDREAEVFGYEVTHGTDRHDDRAATINIHPLTSGKSHAVLRAGPLKHRPAHADALHLDVWLDGRPVAVDAGSYRYTAPEPWGNALADEAVHNLPSQPGVPQATRAGRFFWRSWTDAAVVFHDRSSSPVILARLDLPGGATIYRLVAVADDQVIVIDQADAAIHVRWNLPRGTDVSSDAGEGRLLGDGFFGAIRGGVGWLLPEPTERDPASGWHAPTYGSREPLRAVIVPSDARHRVVTWFGLSPLGSDAEVFSRCAALDLERIQPADARALLVRGA